MTYDPRINQVSGANGSTKVGDTNTYSNFTPTASTVKGALSGIDTAIGAVSSASANSALSNLTSTAVNTDIIPNNPLVHDLGASSFNWLAVYTANVISDAILNLRGETGVSVTTDPGTTTGNIGLTSGNASGGNSGGIALTIGTATGTRGKIKFVDGSEGTSGQIWTSTDTLGNGHWAPSSGGAPLVMNANNNNSNQTVSPNTNQTVIFHNVLQDETGGYNSSTGIWTAPSNGKVQVQGSVMYVNPAEKVFYYLGALVAGTFRGTQSNFAAVTSSEGTISVACNVNISVTTGQTIQIVTRADFSNPSAPSPVNTTLLGGVLTGGNDAMTFSLLFFPTP